MKDDEKITPEEKPQETPKSSAEGTDAPESASESSADKKPASPSVKAPTQEAWDSSYKKEAWSATPGGRLAIRTFSRGILGALFFTVGGKWARNMMMHENQYNAERSMAEVLESKNPFHVVAKVIDDYVGRPISTTVNHFGGDGVRAVHFKPTKYKREYTGGEVLGRSLGEETMFVTFDFFCASIGDALGRDILGWVDPVQREKWAKENVDEKGNLSLPKTVTNMCKAMWRYVSYNGGEDWAVALPYVFFMKAQRNFIDTHISPGYGYESDIALNASSLKMNTDANPHQVTGSYAMEAMMDYQTRFTVYNIGTLMYREMYDKIANSFQDKHVNLYGTPDAPADPNKTIGEKATDLVKWTMRSALKGVLFMTPTVPFFSITRSTQNRRRALFVDPKRNAALGFYDPSENPHFLTAQHVKEGLDRISASTPVHYATYDQDYNHGRGIIREITGAMPSDVANPTVVDPNYTPYKMRNNMAENALSYIGHIGHKFANFMGDRVARFNDSPRAQPVRKILGLREGENFSNFAVDMAHAAVSYTPYMYAKGEFATLLDYGKMDLAAERLIDGIFSGKWKEVKAGADEVSDAIFHKPFEDAAREAEGNRRTLIDTSAAADFTDQEARIARRSFMKNEEVYRLRAEKARELYEPFDEAMKSYQEENPSKKSLNISPSSELPWQQRLFQGTPEADDPGKSVSTKHSPQTHAEREEMRKIFEGLTPPTNSIH